MQINTPISDEVIKGLKIYDTIEITGVIYTGRDAVLPKIVKLIEVNKWNDMNINLEGSVIFHTAVSPAGIGPTSSNKHDIESSIPELSKAGVKIHLGKGSLNESTAQALKENNSIFAITPPLTALLCSKVEEQSVVAFPEEGMEAFHKLKVVSFPAIVAIANGESIFDK